VLTPLACSPVWPQRYDLVRVSWRLADSAPVLAFQSPWYRGGGLKCGSFVLNLLPPKIADTVLFSLILEVIADRPVDLADLRVRLMNFSPQAWVDVASNQGVLFPFIRALKSRSLLLPVPIGENSAVFHKHPTLQLEAVYRRHLDRRRDQCDQLIEVVRALNGGGVVPLLLKGARYLIAPVDPWCEARDMRDLDLLVQKGETDQAVSVLKAVNYRFEEGFVPVDQHLPELRCAGRPSAVEIHTHSLPFSARIFLSTTEVWQHAIPVSAEKVRFFVLPNEWQLLHCLLNHQLADHGHARRILGAKGLWELTMLGTKLPEEGWQAIVNHLERHGQLDLLASWMVQASRIFGLTYPQWIKISSDARAHADETFARATAPEWWRRLIFLVDQLRFGFARETLAARYQLNEADVSLRTVARHISFLARRYRGRMLRRLTGRF
jgi:hypothetical protein